MRRLAAILLCVMILPAYGQDTLEDDATQDSAAARIRFIDPYPFWTPSAEYNPPRVATVSSGLVALYGVLNIWLSQAWYKDFDRSPFHTFNDGKEWLQLDKAGHIVSAYYINRLGYDLYNWAGLKKNAAVWAGVGVAQAYQMVVELQDGFSQAWGFSWPDVAANLSGSALYVGQHYLWGEQRFVLKESAWPYDHPEHLQDRADDLFGSSFSEQLLKDYNATTFWLTASIGSFIRKDHKFPKWIGLSFGYGGRGMYGGFENRWCDIEYLELRECPEDQINTSAADIDRVRQFYLSLDIDFTKIPVKSNALKAFLEVINIIKIPFPAVEFNTAGEVNWHWLMF
jgi:hypothetical protein